MPDLRSEKRGVVRGSVGREGKEECIAHSLSFLHTHTHSHTHTRLLHALAKIIASSSLLDAACLHTGSSGSSLAKHGAYWNMTLWPKMITTACARTSTQQSRENSASQLTL